MDYNLHLICRDCREEPANLVEEYSSGDYVCGSCGLVLGQIVDERSEWRTFNNENEGSRGSDPNRVGDSSNPYLAGNQLHTFIGGGDKAASSALTLANSATNLNTINKALLPSYAQIEALCAGCGLPETVTNCAKQLYRISLEKKYFAGKRVPPIHVISACIHIACRQCSYPRAFKEIQVLTCVDKVDIGRAFRKLDLKFKCDNPHLEMGGGEIREYNAGSTGAADLMPRYCSLLNLPKYSVSFAQDVARRYSRDVAVEGKSPMSIAVAVVFWVSNITGTPRTIRQISSLFSTSSDSALALYRHLYVIRSQLITGKWRDDPRINNDLSPVPYFHPHRSSQRKRSRSPSELTPITTPTPTIDTTYQESKRVKVE